MAKCNSNNGSDWDETKKCMPVREGGKNKTPKYKISKEFWNL